MESSNQLGNRRAAKDTVLGGVAVPSGSYLHICIGAANRNPEQYADPDRLDIRRQPNRHLAFGTGIHACAGMSLARMGRRKLRSAACYDASAASNPQLHRRAAVAHGSAVLPLIPYG